MSEPLIHEPDEHPVLQPRSGGALRVLLWIAVLFSLAGLAAYALLNIELFGVAPRGDAASPGVTKETISREEFSSRQREAAAAEQSMIANIMAQQAALKQLTDQVAALSAKIDEMQRSATLTPTPTPVPAPADVSVPPPRQPRAVVKRPKSAGSISVGGAPLPAPPAER